MIDFPNFLEMMAGPMNTHMADRLQEAIYMFDKNDSGYIPSKLRCPELTWHNVSESVLDVLVNSKYWIISTFHQTMHLKSS